MLQGVYQSLGHYAEHLLLARLYDYLSIGVQHIRLDYSLDIPDILVCHHCSTLLHQPACIALGTANCLEEQVHYADSSIKVSSWNLHCRHMLLISLTAERCPGSGECLVSLLLAVDKSCDFPCKPLFGSIDVTLADF